MNKWEARAEVYEEMAAESEETAKKLYRLDSTSADGIIQTAMSMRACARMMRDWAKEDGK